MTSESWNKLGLALINSPDVPRNLQPVVCAQAIGESGRGVSWTATEALNFWSLKWRDGLGVDGVMAPDRYEYCKFSTHAQAVAVYWKFIHRSPYYDGVDEHLADPADFIGFIGGHFCPPGYSLDWILKMGMDYTGYIISFLPEATAFLESLGWMPAIATPQVPPPATDPLGWRILNKNGNDYLAGPAWFLHPVKNFDRIRINPQRIIFHYSAALGEGVMDPWNVLISQRSAHLYPTRDGRLYQCVPLNFRSWAAGRWNPTSINIELEGLGCFVPNERKANSWYDPKTDRFYRRFWPNIIQSAPRSEFVLRRHPKENRFIWWHTFTEEQIDLVAAFLPTLKSYCPHPPIICGHDEVELSKVDPFPFPIDLFR
jgi:hypothetical protein